MKCLSLNFKKSKINAAEISALIGLIVAIFSCFFKCISTSENVAKNVLRLHILANSNSKEDQDLKLKIRDKILSDFNFNSLDGNIEKSKIKIKKEIPNIEKVAKQKIKELGFNYDVKAELKNMYFNTREYEGFAMPAGFYDALQIKIGDAKGKNWWCVLVPSMCIPAANKKEEIFDTFDSDEKNLIKNGFKTEVRFAAIEFFKNLFFN